MTVSRDRWTCPECSGTELLPDQPAERDAIRTAAQLAHGARHRGEGREALPLHEALDVALAGTGGHGAARVLVHPRDAPRVAQEAIRRGLRLVPCASYAVTPGRGLPLPPVTGADRRADAR